MGQAAVQCSTSRSLDSEVIQNAVQEIKAKLFDKDSYYRSTVWPGWVTKLKASPKKMLFVPGVMGSDLWDVADHQRAWIDFKWLSEQESFAFKDVDSKGKTSSSVNLVGLSPTKHPLNASEDMYHQIFHDPALQAACYAWDWRDDMILEAVRLEKFIRFAREDAELQHQPINIVAHGSGAAVVLLMLKNTHELDFGINSISFVAPVFGGSLLTLQALEHGSTNGGTLESVGSKDALKHWFSTFPGIFQMLPAPRDLSELKLPLERGVVDNLSGQNDEKTIDLQYPLLGRTGPQGSSFVTDLYVPGGLSNSDNMHMREALLQRARQFHNEIKIARITAAGRMRNKINVIVGLQGKTPFAAQPSEVPGCKWAVHFYQGEPDKGLYFNGDGVVSFQSSFLPGIDKRHHWAVVPRSGLQHNLHCRLMETPMVLTAIKQVVNSVGLERVINPDADEFGNPMEAAAQVGRQCKNLWGNLTFSVASLRNDVSSGIPHLVGYNDFINRIDFRAEKLFALRPLWFESLDYMGRAMVRGAIENEWKPPAETADELAALVQAIDPQDGLHHEADTEVFESTHKAALRVIKGERLEDVCVDLKVSPVYVKRHTFRLFAPYLA